jgi:ABC-2 type transport system permease protein
MSGVWLIAKRELSSYSRSPLGAVIIAVALLINGILFYVESISQQLLSGEALAKFFFNASGLTSIAALLLSFRTIAEERQTKTFTLLNTSPITGAEIVLGKFLSAFTMVVILTVLSVYMPILLYVTGKVSLGHIAVGYVGLFLIGAAATAVGLFASSLTNHQVIAIITGAGILALLYVQWMVATVTDAPLNDYLAGLAFHHLNFRSFQLGILELRGVVYYLVVTYVFLLAATKVLEARRWR